MNDAEHGLFSEGSPPWLADFDTHDYRLIWRGKRLEDVAQKHIVRDWLPHPGRCLELGGGFGRITKVLESKADEILMLEYSKRNLGIAKTRLSRSSLIRTDVSRIPVKDSMFDSVVMVRVIHLLPNPRAVMLEILRVAKAGATVVVSVPNLAVNNLLWAAKAKLFPASIRNRTPTFGPAAWPFDERPYFITPKDFAPKNFEILQRRGTGIFDNAAGRLFDRSEHLYLVDVATSPLWFLKPDIFLKFRVAK